MVYNIFPLTQNLRADTYPKAFFLNALATALIAVLAIEMRLELNTISSRLYRYTNYLLQGHKPFTELQKSIIAFIMTFFVALIVYGIMYAFFLFGGGMLVQK